MGLIRYSCGNISGPHGPISTKVWAVKIFHHALAILVFKLLKFKKFFVTSSLRYPYIISLFYFYFSVFYFYLSLVSCSFNTSLAHNPIGNLTQSRWRLSNGSSPAEGRLEYRSKDGDWVCVCSHKKVHFSRYHGDKICQEFGFKQMLSYYQFSSTFLFGGCFGEIYHIVADDKGVSAIPYEGLYHCLPQETVGLHCVKSK